jgi:HPt (histidine-containing phosphotransfer) domain-containing protein
VEDVRAAVGPHIPLLYEFMGHEEAEVRLVVAEALGSYAQHAADSLEQLRAAMRTKPDEQVRQSITASLAALSKVE